MSTQPEQTPVCNRTDRHRVYKDADLPKVWWAMPPAPEVGVWRDTYEEAAEWMRTQLVLKAAFAEGVAL